MNVSQRTNRPRWASVAVVASYCLAVAGVNLPNPLAPLSAEQYGYGPSLQSAFFSLYLAALVAGLVLVPKLVRSTPANALRLMLAAAAVMVLADAALAASQVQLAAMFAARLLGGISLALGTGGAATLALAVAGEAGRAAVGVGAVAGTLAGNAAGALLADVLPHPVLLVPAIHAVLVLASSATLLALPAGTQQESSREQQAAGLHIDYATRHRAAGYILAGMVLALAPAAVRSISSHATLTTASAPAVFLLAAAFIAQRALARHMLRVRAWMLCLPLVGGTVVFALALQEHSVPSLIAAGALIGLGQGPAYNLGLVTVTHRLPAALQGRAASRYAAVAYACCGVVVLAAGLAARQAGTATAFLLAAVLLAAAGAASAALAGARQQALAA